MNTKFVLVCFQEVFNQFASDGHAQILNTHSDFCVSGREPYQHAPCHCAAWRVYTQLFLGVHVVTVRWPRTEGTANNERVHSFCGFLPNPFIQHLFLWHTSQEIVKTDLISIVTRSLISLWYAICSTGRWSIIGRCFGACQRSNCAEERQP